VLFFEYDRDIPLNARVLERDQNGARIREKMVFSGLHPSRVPGCLFIPALGSPPYPCVLMAHGMGGSKESSSAVGPNQTNITNELLSAVLAVLVLDAPFHGERTADIDFESIYSFMRPNIYRELVIQWTVEYRQAVDYLTTRSEVDSERIGILGYSLGGVMAFCLAAVEPRIRAAVVAGTAPLTPHYVNLIGWDEAALVRMTPIAPQRSPPPFKALLS